MNIFQAIDKRQSTRTYLSQPVEKEKIEQCLEAARLAPSACNAQGWTFVVVDEPKLRERIANLSSSMGMNKFVAQASVIIAVVLEQPNFTSWIGSIIKRKDYTLIDIGIAAEHICLQATELGLGSCMIGWFDERKIKKALSIPRRKHLVLLISLGYSNENHRYKIRKNFDKIVKYNQYQ